MASTLGIASSALLSFQRSLATTGHNIANVNTEGYTRQSVDYSTQTPQQFGAGYLGSGVKVDAIQRIYDDFLERQLRSSVTARDSSEMYYNFAVQVDDLLADQGSSLGPQLENFFSAIQDVVNDPTSIPARQLMLTEAGSLVESFQYIDNELNSLDQRINVELENQVNEINGLLSGIADLNRDIALASGSGTGPAPNDLLDKRDQLLLDLSSRIGYSTVTQDDGSINIFLGNGQAAVVGQTAATLSVEQNAFDPQQFDVGFTLSAGSTSVITDQISGGTLGGIIDFRNEVLNPARDELGRIAVSVAETFNAQHDLGLDLNGNLGSSLADFFTVTDPQTEVYSDLDASSTAAVTVAFDSSNIDKLTGDEYRLAFDGSNWTLTNLSDNSTVTGSGSTPTFNDSNLGEGLTITLSGSPVTGDEFLLRPTRSGSTDLAVGINDPSQVAAASPVRIQEAVGSSGIPTNSGTGELSFGTVTASASLPLSSSITLTYDATAKEFSYGSGPTTFSYDPATDAGNTFTVSGIQFTISGNPADGDQFVIENNSSGVGDSRNMLALAKLQTGLTMNNGTASYQDVYGQLIADVGVKTRRAETLYTTQSNLADSAQIRHDEVSGVNLDEEAANLLRFQQAYQAASQVIVVSEQIFQTLLNATGR